MVSFSSGLAKHGMPGGCLEEALILCRAPVSPSECRMRWQQWWWQCGKGMEGGGKLPLLQYNCTGFSVQKPGQLVAVRLSDNTIVTAQSEIITLILYFL